MLGKVRQAKKKNIIYFGLSLKKNLDIDKLRMMIERDDDENYCCYRKKWKVDLKGLLTEILTDMEVEQAEARAVLKADVECTHSWQL